MKTHVLKNSIKTYPSKFAIHDGAGDYKHIAGIECNGSDVWFKRGYGCFYVMFAHPELEYESLVEREEPGDADGFEKWMRENIDNDVDALAEHIVLLLEEFTRWDDETV